jgi:[CysO sulfur-carrier protein]-S-L-cysteine hydrolase
MKLLLPPRIVKRLRRELRGRRQEIGGILVGESVGGDIFRLVDISVQHSGGSVVHFVRDPDKDFLAKFFERTEKDYTRFNYIGEWHSHPAFEPLPSREDIGTMVDIIEDPYVGVNFAILIIARLERRRLLQLSATLFRRGVAPEAVNVEIEARADEEAPLSILARVRDFFGLS